jgi:hypothetical protein
MTRENGWAELTPTQRYQAREYPFQPHTIRPLQSSETEAAWR